MRFILLSAVCVMTISTACPALSDGTVPFEPVTVFNALVASYGERIEDMGWAEGEPYITVRGTRIYYAQGRMLAEVHRSEHTSYDPILYRYPTGTVSTLPQRAAYPANRSTDFLDALIGDTPEEISRASGWIDFLGRRVFMHHICREPLKRVERKILEVARRSQEVRSYVEDIRIMFSMDARRVDGSNALSYHAYGLAVDIVPKTYNGKQVYWRWSAAWKVAWDSIPLTERWQPPQAVIDAFESEGFVWGGKWYHFDTIHFEYRPEIILLNGQQSAVKRLD
jgi:hypothetical protein